MDIVIVADFCGNFDGKSNSRFLYLANLLSDKNSVEVVTSDFYHGNKKRIKLVDTNYPYKLSLLCEPPYKKNISIKRFYSHFIWACNVKKYISNRKHPDVFYCAVPTLSAAYFVSRYGKKRGIPVVIDIQDLWPEAFRMSFDIPIISDLLFFPFLILENSIYKNASSICAVSKSYVKRALKNNKNIENGQAVFLGTDFNMFDSSNEESEIQKSESDFWIGYCGSMSESYDLNCVIDAMAEVSNQPILIAIGDGLRRKNFEQYAKEKHVKAIFTGRLNYMEMCSLLKRCDIVINPIRGKSAASIINKHGDYAASGLPVINTQDSPEYKELVEKYNMGFNCNNGDYIDVAEKIRILMDNPKLRLEMGKNARRCGEELFDRSKTYKELIASIYEVVGEENEK